MYSLLYLFVSTTLIVDSDDTKVVDSHPVQVDNNVAHEVEVVVLAAHRVDLFYIVGVGLLMPDVVAKPVYQSLALAPNRVVRAGVVRAAAEFFAIVPHAVFAFAAIVVALVVAVLESQHGVVLGLYCLPNQVV